MTEDVEVLIVGGGPAGLSAALLLGRCRRHVLVCDSGHPRNAASRAVHGLLGHEGTAPESLLAKGRAELLRYPNVAFRRVAVDRVTSADSGFAFTCTDGTTGSARKLLVATGLIDELPPIEGVERFYGSTVHHCLYCDGFEHRDRPLAAYGNAEKGPGLALMMKQWSADVVLLTGGDMGVSNGDGARLAANGISVLTQPIRALEGSGGMLRRISFRDGSHIERTALFFSTGCKPRSDLLRELTCARDDKGGYACDPLTAESTVAGLYIAGDVSRDVLLVAAAMGEGVKAAVAINRALLTEQGLLAG